jgi:2Fe-2S ferredoxin
MKINVDVPNFEPFEVTGRTGWTVMDAIRDAGVPVRAECGGGKICATCHVHVADPYFAAFPAPDEEEVMLLSEAENYDPATSRLSCQLICEDKLDGLQIILQPDAIDI